MGVTATILHVLLLPYHTQYLMIQINDFDIQIILKAGGELLSIHMDTAFTREPRVIQFSTANSNVAPKSLF